MGQIPNAENAKEFALRQDELNVLKNKRETVNGINFGGTGDFLENGFVNGLNLNGVGSYYVRTNGISVAGFFNCLEINNGLQIGLWNFGYISNGMQVCLIGNSTSKVNGIQIGGFNQAGDHLKGMQIGLVNKATQANGIQIGLWNKIGDRGLPLVNGSFKKITSEPQIQLPTNIDSIPINTSAQEDRWYEEPYKRLDHTFLTFQPGMWVPLGNLRKTFTASPSFTLKFGNVPLYKDKILLDVGLNCWFPSHTTPFNFHEKDTALVARGSNVNVNVSAYGVYRIPLANKMSLNPYLGLGVATLGTGESKPKKKDADEKEAADRYSVTTFNINPGISFKSIVANGHAIGFFVEYNFSGYTWTDQLDKNFGGSAFQFGILMGI